MPKVQDPYQIWGNPSLLMFNNWPYVIMKTNKQLYSFITKEVCFWLSCMILKKTHMQSCIQAHCSSTHVTWGALVFGEGGGVMMRLAKRSSSSRCSSRRIAMETYIRQRQLIMSPLIPSRVIGENEPLTAVFNKVIATRDVNHKGQGKMKRSPWDSPGGRSTLTFWLWGK